MEFMWARAIARFVWEIDTKDKTTECTGILGVEVPCNSNTFSRPARPISYKRPSINEGRDG